MSREPINGHLPEVRIFDREGGPVAEALTPREVLTLVLIDSALKADRRFHRDHPNATLEQIRSARGVDEHQPGRYCLLYRSAKGEVEFGGHTDQRDGVDYVNSTVGVRLPDQRKQLELLKAARERPVKVKRKGQSAA